MLTAPSQRGEIFNVSVSLANGTSLVQPPLEFYVACLVFLSLFCTLSSYSTHSDNCSENCAVACTSYNSCPLCNAGYTGNDCESCEAGLALVAPGVCEECFIGSWSDVNSTSCTFCEAGTFSTAVKATSIDACQACPLGTYTAIPGLSNCSLCLAGFTTTVNGSSTCTPVTSTSSGGNSASTVGAAVGASLGFIALVLLILLVVLFVRRRRQNEKQFSSSPRSDPVPPVVLLKSQHQFTAPPASSEVDEEFDFIANMVRRASVASDIGPIRLSMFEGAPGGSFDTRRPSIVSESDRLGSRRSTAWLHNPDFWV